MNNFTTMNTQTCWILKNGMNACGRILDQGILNQCILDQYPFHWISAMHFGPIKNGSNDGYEESDSDSDYYDYGGYSDWYSVLMSGGL